MKRQIRPDEIDDILDLLWSRLVKIEHPFCWFPGCGKATQEACHIMKRRHRATRWLPKNGLGGCQYHNQWEEANTKKAEALIREYVGDLAYDELKDLSSHEAHHSFDDKITMMEALKHRLEECGQSLKANPIQKKSGRSDYKKRVENFKASHGGLSPYQFNYRRAKKFRESVDNYNQFR